MRTNKGINNSGPMADIAFLLLIFFMITTHFQTEQGIPSTLPVMGSKPKRGAKEISVEIVSDELLIFNQDRIVVSRLEAALSELLLKGDSMPQILFKSSKDVSYNLYVLVFDKIRSGIKNVRNTAAFNQYGSHFASLNNQQKEVLKMRYPLRIIEVVGD